MSWGKDWYIMLHKPWNFILKTPWKLEKAFTTYMTKFMLLMHRENLINHWKNSNIFKVSDKRRNINDQLSIKCQSDYNEINVNFHITN